MGLTKKQHEVYQFIKSYTGQKGYAPTQREIRDHFGLKSYGSVQRYLKYLKEAGLLTTDWNAKRGLTLIKEEEKEGQGQRQEENHSSLHEIEVPLLGDVAAGNPIEALENPLESISIPGHLLGQTNPTNRHQSGAVHFALRVCGDSMIEDGILDGDLAILKHIQDAQTGETIVAVIDGEATLKKFYKKKNHIELHPANSSFKPIIVDSHQDCKIVGRLIGLLRTY